MELGVTPVPIGTLSCRLCRAISMWLVARTRGIKAVSDSTGSNVKNGDILNL